MADKNETLIHESHERLIKEFMKEISDLISNIQEPIAENGPDVSANDFGRPPATDEVPAPCQEEHSGPDKINEIRNEVAATQSTGILNPDKQTELMEIIKRRSEDFERELRRIVPTVDANTIASGAKQFKDELMDNAQKQLRAKKYTFTN
jgi:hypothetical protein